MKTEHKTGRLAAWIHFFFFSPEPEPEDPPWVMDTELSKPVPLEFAPKSRDAAKPRGLNCYDTLPRPVL